MNDEVKPTPRLTGPKAVAQRARRRAREPLCRHCLAAGRVTASEVIDHIIPLIKGGPDTDDNTQALCITCHDNKTRQDFGYKSKPTFGLDGWPV